MSEEISQFTSTAESENGNEGAENEASMENPDVDGTLWAEQVDNDAESARGASSDGDYEEIELPQVLCQLISVSGVSLASTPDNTWNINGYSAKLRRNLSVTFSVDAEITGFDILEGFTKAGIDPESITSIQYRGCNWSWVVSFTDQLTKEAVLELGRITIKEFLVFLGDADLRTVIVKIYETPPEMPDTVVIGRLSHYGRVLSFRRDRGISTGIFNGVRTARMRISKNIPSSIRIAGEAVSISYSGQPKTCCKSGDEGHLASGCKNPRCYNCESPGHRAAECDKQPLCGICLESKHPIANCPFLIFSANVCNDEEDPDYAGAVRADAVGRVRKSNSGNNNSSPPSTSQASQRSDQNNSRQDKSQNKGQNKEGQNKSQSNSQDNSGKSKSGGNRDKGSRHNDDTDKQRADKDNERNKERNRSKERSKDGSEERSEERGSGRDRRDRDRDRDRDRHSERARDRERDRDRDWSRSRDRDRRDRGGHDRYRDRDRDRSRRHRDHSPQLYSSDSDYDDYRSRSYR